MMPALSKTEERIEVYIGHHHKGNGSMQLAIERYQLANATDELVQCGDECVDALRYTMALKAYDAAGSLPKLRELGKETALLEGKEGVTIDAFTGAGASGLLNNYGQTLLDEGNIHKAKSAFSSTKNKTKLTQVGHMYFNEGDYKNAFLAYSEAGNVRHLIELGDHCAIEGKYALAIDSYKAADSPEKITEAGYELLNMGRVADAHNTFMEAQDSEGLIETGCAYLDRGDIQNAKSSFALAKKKITVDIWLKYAEIHFAEGRISVAKNMYNQAGARGQKKLSALGNVELDSGKLATALASFTHLNDVPRIIEIGKKLMVKGDFSESERAFRSVDAKPELSALASEIIKRCEWENKEQGLRIFRSLGDDANEDDIYEAARSVVNKGAYIVRSLMELVEGDLDDSEYEEAAEHHLAQDEKENYRFEDAAKLYDKIGKTDKVLEVIDLMIEEKQFFEIAELLEILSCGSALKDRLPMVYAEAGLYDQLLPLLPEDRRGFASLLIDYDRDESLKKLAKLGSSEIDEELYREICDFVLETVDDDDDYYNLDIIEIIARLKNGKKLMQLADRYLKIGDLDDARKALRHAYAHQATETA